MQETVLQQSGLRAALVLQVVVFSSLSGSSSPGANMAMGISISTRMIDGVVIIDVFGQLRLGEATSKLRNTVQDLLRDGYKKLLLNMAEVQHIDSSGIGELMTTYSAVKGTGGELKLLNLHKNVRNLLQVTRLYTIFDVQEDLTTAVNSYR